MHTPGPVIWLVFGVFMVLAAPLIAATQIAIWTLLGVERDDTYRRRHVALTRLLACVFIFLAILQLLGVNTGMGS